MSLPSWTHLAIALVGVTAGLTWWQAGHHISPEWAAAVAALLVPSPLTRSKGAPMKILALIQTLLVLVGLAVALAEEVFGAGSGTEKKARVIADLQAQLPAALAKLGVAQGIIDFLTQEAVLSFAIDMVVMAYNTLGHFTKQPAPEAAPADPTAAPAV